MNPPSPRSPSFAPSPASAFSPAFTLVELLVVIAIVALLAAFLYPVLGAGREAGRAAVCLSNLRQMFIVCRQYADEHRGFGPAIGQPYAAIPNWALVVQAAAGRAGSSPSDLYTTGSRVSVLVCPTAEKVNARPMQRTYAMNATGHAGLTRPDGTTDPTDFDTPSPPASSPLAHINMDAPIPRPSDTPLLIDSRIDAAQALAPGAPPPTRTASVLDFRQEPHVSNRLGDFHTQRQFQFAAFDGSAKPGTTIPDWWRDPLP
jgi:prepilin-type N-terminal cleavage/methylation domain-containing protein